MTGPLHIVGASARAAAQSALRGGFRPTCSDMFADLDLASLCPVQTISPYPAGLEAIFSSAPSKPWMYTGALENHPALIDRLAQLAPLYGNPGSVLSTVRNPFQTAAAWHSAGLSTIPLQATPEQLPRDGSWLCKPWNSAGGRNIQPWRDGDMSTKKVYYQAFQPGRSCAGAFVAAGGKCVFLGATWQLIGEAFLHAGPFHYAGSWGPWAENRKLDEQWQAIGQCVAKEFDLVGLFGIDAVLHEETLYPVEVNPRYTASLEILERAADFSAVSLHVSACCHVQLPTKSHFPVHFDKLLHAKGILYSPGTYSISPALSSHALHSSAADIPHPGTLLEQHHPILTLFTSAAAPSDVLASLKRLADEFTERLLRED